MTDSSRTSFHDQSTTSRHWLTWTARLPAAIGCVLLLLSVGVSKSGQNIGGAVLILAFLLAGPGAWRAMAGSRLAWATAAWIAGITASLLYAVFIVGIPLDYQADHLWKFSRFFLIPLVAWAVAVSGLGAYRAYLILFAGYCLGLVYFMNQAGWPWFFSIPGRRDISGENVQYYGMLSVTALIAASVFSLSIRDRVGGFTRRAGHYGFWIIVALAAVQGLFVSKTRGALLALALALIVWSGIYLVRIFRQRAVSPVGFVVAILVAAVFVGALFYTGSFNHPIRRTQKDLMTLMQGRDPETGFFKDSEMGIRFNQWQAALSAWTDHKLLGHGPNGSLYVRSRIDLPEKTAAVAPHHFHNIYLDVLVRFGLVGMALLAWFLIACQRTMRAGNGPLPHPVSLFGTLAMVIFLVAGLTQTFLTSQVSWFYLAGSLGPACAAAFHTDEGLSSVVSRR